MLTPMQIRRFRLNRAPEDEARWLLGLLDCECRRLGSRVERQDDGDFRVVAE
jgi:poly-gamma-glutamate synthesis protein (capsule biosynthesis protein)